MDTSTDELEVETKVVALVRQRAVCLVIGKVVWLVEKMAAWKDSSWDNR